MNPSLATNPPPRPRRTPGSPPRPRPRLGASALAALAAAASPFPLAAGLPAGALRADGEAVPGKVIPSAVTAVVVFADRAQVTREARATLGGDRELFRIEGLPPWVNSSAVRVNLQPAASGAVLDVRAERRPLGDEKDPAVVEARAALEEINDQIGAIGDELTVLDKEAAQLESMKVFSLEKLPLDAAARAIDVAEYEEVIHFFTASLHELTVKKRDIEKRLRGLEPERKKRQEALENALARTTLTAVDIVVSTRGKPGARVTLGLEYEMPGAGWEPAHDLRSVPGAPEVTLTSFGLVRQATGEDWTDARVHLSTEGAADASRAPELTRLLTERGALVGSLLGAPGAGFSAAKSRHGKEFARWVKTLAPALEPALAEAGALKSLQARAAAAFKLIGERGAAHRYPALVPISVPSDGRTVRVPIGEATLPATYHLTAAPEISPKVARTVDLEHRGSRPLLPGNVSLYLDGAFVGITPLALTAPGKSFSLFLGSAEGIEVSRALDPESSELTTEGGVTRIFANFVVTVDNKSGRRARVDLAERIPVPTVKEVALKSVRAQPSARPDKHGVARWALDLAPGEKTNITLSYRLEFPANLKGKTPFHDFLRDLQARFE